MMELFLRATLSGVLIGAVLAAALWAVGQIGDYFSLWNRRKEGIGVIAFYALRLCVGLGIPVLGITIYANKFYPAVSTRPIPTIESIPLLVATFLIGFYLNRRLIFSSKWWVVR